MAFYLQFDGVDDYTDAVGFTYGSNSTKVTIDVQMLSAANGQWIFMTGAEAAGSMQFLVNFNSIRVDNFGASIGTPLVDLPKPVTDRCVYVIEDSASGTTVTQDGVLIISTPSRMFGAENPTSSFKLGRYISGGSYASMDLYAFKVENNGTVIHDYNFQSPNGLGTNLPDDVGTNNATIINGTAWASYTPTGNVAPTASAGADQPNVTQGSTVTLDATGSTDDVGISSYSWVQTGAGTTVTLSDATIAQPTFTAPSVAETLTFEVTVTDDGGLTSTDTVNISVASVGNAPTANAGTDFSIIGGEGFILNGYDSLDANGLELSEAGNTISSVLWTQPSGNTLSIHFPSRGGTPITTSVVTVEEVVTFQFTVTDINGLTSSDTIVITIVPADSDRIPTANAGNDVASVSSETLVTLDGTSSSDNVGVTKYKWKQISGAYAVLDDKDISTPSFTTPSLTNRTPFAQDIYGDLLQSTPSSLQIPNSLSKFVNITYAGAMRANITSGGVNLNSDFAYGPLGLSADKLGLFIVGNQLNCPVGEIEIPTSLSLSDDVSTMPAAITRQAFVNVRALNTSFDFAWDAGQNQPVDRINGILEFNGNLLMTAENSYDANGLNQDSMQVFANANNIATGGNKGYLHVEGAAHAAGWMSKVPANLQTLVGSDYVMGWATNNSIITRYSIGPSLFNFNPQDAINADLVANITVPTTPLLDYTITNPIVADGFQLITTDVSPVWGSTAKANYAFFIPNTDFLLVIGSHGGVVDGINYKIIQPNGLLGAGQTSNTASDNYNYFWLYNVNDIIGATNPYDPKPFSFGKWSHPFDNATTDSLNRVSGAVFDDVNSRLYLTLNNGARLGQNDYVPLIIAYDISAKTEDTAISTDVTDMVFELETTNAQGLKSTDTVTVSLSNVAPTDTTAPTITINPAQTTYNLTVGDAFSSPVGTSTDAVDGVFTVIPTGSVDTNTAGTYTLTYSDTDAAGNVATPIVVTVNVSPAVVNPSTSALVMSLTGIPDGTYATRVIDATNSAVLYSDSVVWASGSATVNGISIDVGSAVEYYAIGATEGGLQRGVTS